MHESAAEFGALGRTLRQARSDVDGSALPEPLRTGPSNTVRDER
jgi:hypothetical protein